MARCPNCHEEVPDDAGFCPHCGYAQPRRAPRLDQQPSLPFSPWSPPPLAMQPIGTGVTAQRLEPVVGPPLSITTVGIAVVAIMLFLLLFFFIGRRSAISTLPVVGIKGEAINVGDTTWGVAFTDQAERIENQPPKQGQFYAVGIIVGNRGQDNIDLSLQSVGLIDEDSNTRYTPRLTAWGTPDQITAGQYRQRFTLPPQRVIAGLIVFDVPKDIKAPRLLVRDLHATELDFTGEIDLTKEKPRSGGSVHSLRLPALPW